jgi:hypothetical protein
MNFALYFSIFYMQCHNCTQIDNFLLCIAPLVVPVDPVHCHRRKCWHRDRVLGQSHVWRLYPRELLVCSEGLTYTRFHYFCKCFRVFVKAHSSVVDISFLKLPFTVTGFSLITVPGFIIGVLLSDVSGCPLADHSGSLRHELSSPAQTLGLWVRIPFEALMSVCVYSVCVVLCLPWSDPPSKESSRLCKKIKKVK